MAQPKNWSEVIRDLNAQPRTGDRIARHVDIRFAGVSDETLRVVVREYDEWQATQAVAADAELRHLATKFGGTPSPTSMIAAALSAFREILAREGIA